MSMTWGQLAAHIEVMDPEQKKTDVTVQLLPIDEFFRVGDINFTVGDDVLDDNHPYLEILATDNDIILGGNDDTNASNT